jgi:hypothetical protein
MYIFVYIRKWTQLNASSAQAFFVALLTVGPPSQTTGISSGAAYDRDNVAYCSYFNEWRCRYLPLRLPPPILFTLLIPLTIVFVGKGVI